MDKWFKDILSDKDPIPYHNRRRDQMKKKGVRNSSACDIRYMNINFHGLLQALQNFKTHK